MRKFLATFMMACLLFGTVGAFAQPTPGDEKKTEAGEKKEHKGKKDKDKKDKDKKDKDEKKAGK